MTYTFRALMCTFLLAGCAKEAPAPVYVTGEVPELPRECFVREIAPVPEPKLNPNQDATDLDAVKDREAWKRAFRTEKSFRSTCGARLEKLFGQERPKPTS